MTELEAIEANLFAYPLFHAWSRAEGYDGPDLLWAISDIPAALFNSVGRANLGAGAADEAIEGLIARARTKRVPLLWWTSPSSKPADLARRLEGHGFRHVGELPGMALERAQGAGGGAQENSELRIETVRDAEMLKIWNDVPEGSAERYAFYAEHLGAFRHYIGYADGRAVATTSLFFGGGTAGIYNVYTAPAMRSRGFGAALTRAAVSDACDLGHRLVVLQATQDSAPLYRRLGFVEHCSIGHYLWPVAG